MRRKLTLKTLKTEIESRRQKLNNLVEGDLDKAKVLNFSVELDKLIYEYYFLQENRKRA